MDKEKIRKTEEAFEPHLFCHLWATFIVYK